MSLPNVRAIARVEGWTVEPDPTYTDGLSYRIGGVQVEQDDGDDLDVQ